MLISLDNVTKSYSLDEETTVTPVRSVTLNISPGEFIMVIGRSGSGKTTLLNLAAGLVKPTSGKVIIGGMDVEKATDKDISRLRNEKIGFIFQFPSLLPSLSAIENVALPAFLGTGKKKEEVYECARSLLEMVGLADKAEAYPRQLSAGEQRRVVISRALVNRPEIILADEPTSDLDEQTEYEVMEILRGINESGVTVLMVTHSLELLPFATKALKMEKGYLKETSRSATRELLKTLN